MRKAINILEVPLYLMIIGMYSFNNGSPSMAYFLWLLSGIRLFLNNITYKPRKH